MDDAPRWEQLLVHHDFLAEHRHHAGQPSLPPFALRSAFGQSLKVAQALVPAEAEEGVSQVLGRTKSEPGDYVVACVKVARILQTS